MPRSLAQLDYAILGLLARGPASGYDLRRVFQTTALGRYSDSPGSIYPAIRRLGERLLIVGVPQGERRVRTVLRLTAAGRRAVAEWMERPIAPTDFIRDSAFVDLRLAFVSDIAPQRLAQFLREYAAAAAAHAAALDSMRDAFENDLSPSAGLAFDVGLALAKARATWARKAARAQQAA